MTSVENRKRALTFIFILILITSFFVRLVGLVTFQKAINGEEGGLGVILLEMSNMTSGYKNIGSERGYLHGFSKIYYRPLVKIFTPSVALLKFTTLTTSLVLLAILMILIKMGYDNFLERKEKAHHHRPILFLSWLYIAIPPLLLVVWNLKARPEFLDVMIIGQVLLILALKIVRGGFPLPLLFLAGLTSGLGFSGQPMMIYYILPAVIFITLKYFPKFEIKRAVQSVLVSVSGAFLGLTPLIVHNVRSGWPLIHFLGADIIEGPYDTPAKRISGFFNEAYPMLVGVRNEWKSHNDLLSEPYDRIVIALVSILILLAILLFVREVIKRRRFQDIGLFVIGLICFFVVVAFSNFASFLSEPRRVLPFYSFYFPLISYALVKVEQAFRNWHKLLRTIPVLILISLITVNTFVISRTAYEFNTATKSVVYTSKVGVTSPYVEEYELSIMANRFYKPRNVAVKVLNQMGIKRIYTNTWIGNPITFESQGKVLWKRFLFSKYPSYTGFNFKPTLENAAIILYKDESVVSTLKRLGFKSLEIEDLAVFPNLSNYIESYDQILDKVDSLQHRFR